MKTLALFIGFVGGLLAIDCSANAELGAPAHLSAAKPYRGPDVIVIRNDASESEWLAAQEIRRYAYLRTGRIIPVTAGKAQTDQIVVSRKNRAFCGELGEGLRPQEFTLKTVESGGHTTWFVVGGDEIGTLYGAYRFSETLGVRFALDGDVIPDEPLRGDWPVVEEMGRPRFPLRGLQPFHDFSVGPDWWNLEDYEAVLSQMAKLRLNFIGFHTYPSWNRDAGPEANVWIGLPEEVDERGNVRSGYRAGVVTTRQGWAVKPFPTSRYAAGAGLLFAGDDYGPDYMRDCLEWPTTEIASTAMFNRYGDLQQKAFAQARRLGIKTCVGTETPLGVPKEVAARLRGQSVNPDDPQVVRRLYEGMFLRLARKMPVDYFWLWTPEIWLSEPGCAGWEITSRANVERDVALAQSAAQSVKTPFGLATGGWRLGTGEDSLWMDKRTPKSWPTSAIGTGLGRDRVAEAFGKITGRPKWVIGWAEDDDTAGAHCCTCWDLQLWVARIFANASEAHRYGCEGMMAIHWRTAAIAPNITALAQAGWDLESEPAVGPTTTTDDRPKIEAYWADWGASMFGRGVGGEVGRCLQKLDGSHLKINGLIAAGVDTTDAAIADCFSPLREMESCRSRVEGAGNLERFDYWHDLIEATQARVQTWVLAARLAAKVRAAEKIAEIDAKKALARKEILPMRLELARRYEELIATWVRCAKSPGDIGTIASIESGSRARVVTAQDGPLEALLGGPLPPAATLSTAYRGTPRIFVSARRTQAIAHEPQEIRASVLSSARCTGVNLHWRVLGEGAFQSVAAATRSRQAYRVHLPAQPRSAVEYYLEATLEDGRRVRWPTTTPAINQTVIAW